MPLGDLRDQALHGRGECPFVQVGSIGRIGADGQRVLEEGDGLGMRAEGGSPLGGPAQGDAGLGGEGVCLRPVRCVALGRQVVAGQGAGQLLAAEGLEVARGSQVANLAIALGQRVVGDLADECLDEGVLAALGRAGVDLLDEQLAPDEGAQARLEGRLVDAGDGRQGRRAEALAEHGGVGDDGPDRPRRARRGGPR